MGLFTKKVAKTNATTQICTITGRELPTTEFYKGQPYSKAADDLRRRINRASKGAVGTQQLREMFVKFNNA